MLQGKQASKVVVCVCVCVSVCVCERERANKRMSKSHEIYFDIKWVQKSSQMKMNQKGSLVISNM